MTSKSSLSELANSLSTLEMVRAIGLSGDLENLPEPGKGDLDIFIYCNKIPSIEQRQLALEAIGEPISQMIIKRIPGGHWGQADSCSLAGVETWMMYFTVDETQHELEYIHTFSLKPDDCSQRLLEIIQLGCQPETISSSFTNWQLLCMELKALIRSSG